MRGSRMNPLFYYICYVGFRVKREDVMEKEGKFRNFSLPLAAGFLVLACFFRFVLIGYQTIALLLAGCALFVVLFEYAPKQWMKKGLAGCVLVGVMVLGFLEVPIVMASLGDIPADAEYLIVLGAGVNGSTPSLSLYNRLTAAKEWLEAHPDGKAVLSGGQGPGEELSEAEAMYRWLLSNGLDGSRLYKEEKSATTRENFMYSAVLLRELNDGTLPQTVAVVSSEYHLYRAKYWADKAGFTALGVPAETTLPVLRLNYFLREGAAVGRLFILGY